MKKLLTASLVACAFVLLAAILAGAQTKPRSNGHKNTAHATSASWGSNASRVPIVIVGTAAKFTWATTKFAAGHVALPVAKTVFVKATPAITRFALKNSAKYLLPFAAKLSLL